MAASCRAPNTRTRVWGFWLLPPLSPRPAQTPTCVTRGQEAGYWEHRGCREKPMSCPLVARGGDRVVAGGRGPEQQGRPDTHDLSPCSHPARKLVPCAPKPQKGEATQLWDKNPGKSGMRPKQELFPARGPKGTMAQSGPQASCPATGNSCPPATPLRRPRGEPRGTILSRTCA